MGSDRKSEVGNHPTADGRSEGRTAGDEHGPGGIPGGQVALLDIVAGRETEGRKAWRKRKGLSGRFETGTETERKEKERGNETRARRTRPHTHPHSLTHTQLSKVSLVRCFACFNCSSVRVFVAASPENTFEVCDAPGWLR